MLGGVIDLLLRADSKQLDTTLDQSAAKMRKWKKEVAPETLFQTGIDAAGAKISGVVGAVGGAVLAFGSLHHILSEVKNKLAEITATDKLAERLGMDVGAVEVYSAALRKSGVDAAELAPMFFRLEKAVSEAATGAAEAKGAFDELGLSAAKLKGQSPDQQFRAVIDAISKVPNQADRIRLLMELFGRSGGQLEGMFRKGSKGLDEVAAKLERFHLGVKPEEAESVRQATMAMSEYGMIWEGVWTKITTQFAPDIAAAYAVMTEAALDNSKGMSALDSVMDVGTALWDAFLVTLQLGAGTFHVVRATCDGLIGSIASLISYLPGAGEGIRAFVKNMREAEKKDLAAGESELGNPLGILDAMEKKKKELREKAAADLAKRQTERNKSQEAAGKEGFSRPLNDLISKYETEAKTLFMTSREREIYNANLKGSNAVQENGARILAKKLDAMETEKKLLEADPIYQVLRAEKERNNAYQQGLITLQQWNDAYRKDVENISGVVSAYEKLTRQLDLLNRAKKEGLGAEDLARGLDKAKEDFLGFGDPLKQYTNRIDELNKALKDGKITWDEWNKAAAGALQKSFNGPASIDEQMREWKRKTEAMKKLEGLDPLQKYQMRHEALPDFVKGLYDQTRSPVEQLGQRLKELSSWKKYLSPELYSRGVSQALQQSGMGEARFATAATYGSTEARNILMANRSQDKQKELLNSILKMNADQLNQLVTQTTYTKKIADNQGNYVLLSLP